MTARLWAVDKVLLAYFAFTAAIELIWFRQISDAAELLAWHVLGIALIVGAAQAKPRPGTFLFHAIRFFRNWYPLLFVACCYREMATLIPVLRHARFDEALAAADRSFWGAYPTVWLERIYSPVLTEYLQIIYTLFIPAVLFVPLFIWLQGRTEEFRYMAFLLALGFLASYLGYLIVPARGPRFLLESLQHTPLKGLWLFNSMQTMLNQLEHAHYDCFPSGHTEITVLACWLSRSISVKLFRAYFLYTLCIVFATVYLRYHYTADLLAGVLVALALILAAPRLYRGLSEKGNRLAIEVVTAAGSSGLKEFVELPWSIYGNDPHWVPPLQIAVKELLDRKKHPFYANAEAEFFLARRDGRNVGRIAAIVDRNHNKFHNEKAGFFGFFEAVDDQEVTDALLKTARDWVRARGAEFIRGPVNPSTNYECGTLVEGFESSPMVMMTYNPRYYPRLMEKAGLSKVKDLIAFVNTPDGTDLEKIGRVADRALKRHGVTVRPVNMKDFQGEVARIWDVYNAAWEKNWGFIPMTREEFFLMGKEMKQVLKPEMVLLGESAGRMIGFALALPDVNVALKPANGKLLPTGLLKILYYQRKIRAVRVIALGVVEEFRRSGVAAGFYAELVRNARKLGYTQDCEMSWILEDNVLMTRSLELMGAKRSKTYRLYQMGLTA